MGDCSPYETPAEMLDRLRLMAADERGQKWDLSDNDRTAIAYAVEQIDILRAQRSPSDVSAGVNK